MFIVNLIICDNLHLSTTNYRKTLIFFLWIYIKAVIRNIPDNGFLFKSTSRCSDFYQIAIRIVKTNYLLSPAMRH